MSVVLWCAAGAVVGFAAGWLVRGWRRNSRLRASEERWQELADSLQGQLAIERLRVERYARATDTETEAAPVFDLRAHLAQRPARTPDSSTARA